MEYRKNSRLIHQVITNKFKTNVITVRFFEPLNRSTATARTLIPGLLEAGTISHPSKKAVLKHLEKLYDASISTSVTKTGKLSIVSISIVFIHEKFLKKSIKDEVLSFLREFIFEPNLVGNLFKKEAFLEEVRLTKEYHLNRKNNKISYSLERMKEVMYQGELYEINVDGYLEELDKITLEEATEAYRSMIHTNAVSIVVSGPEDDFSSLKDYPFSSHPVPEAIDTEWIIQEKVKHVSETINTSQMNYNVGYRSTIRQKDPLYPAMILMNSVLGGMPNNLLFDTIREKHSYCYYVRSMFIGFKGALYVNAGIDVKNINHVRELVQKQITRLIELDFSEELLERAKTVLLSQLDQVMDSQGNIHSKVFVDVLLHRPFSLDELKNQIESVTMNEIKLCAETLHLDTEYTLGKEEVKWT